MEHLLLLWFQTSLQTQYFISKGISLNANFVWGSEWEKQKALFTFNEFNAQHEAHKALKADFQVRIPISEHHQITDFITQGGSF